jgi:hypothetical protein
VWDSSLKMINSLDPGRRRLLIACEHAYAIKNVAMRTYRSIACHSQLFFALQRKEGRAQIGMPSTQTTPESVGELLAIY